MYSKLKIKNYRGIRDLEIDGLNKINVLVGKNGIGKSSILEAIYIAINPNNPLLPFKTSVNFRDISKVDLNFWLSYFYEYKENSQIEILLTGSSKQYFKSRSLVITPRKSKMTEKIKIDENKEEKQEDYRTEEFAQGINGLNIQFKIGSKPYHSELFQNAPDSLVSKRDEKFSEDLSGYMCNSKTLTNINLANAFDAVMQSKQKEKIINFLNNFKNTIEDIYLDTANRLYVYDNEFKNEAVSFNIYGDGLFRALIYFLSTLREDSNITIIDEIENGLHFTTQRKLWDLLIPLLKGNKKQLFVTTHSYEMLKNLNTVVKENKFNNMISIYRLEKVKEETRVEHYNFKQFNQAIEDSFEIR